MKVLITGYNGFVGKNLTEKLEADEKYTVIKFGRLNDPNDLERYVEDSDFIFHLAGINRPISEKEFYEGNYELTKKLVDLLIFNNKKIGIAFSSSIQAEMDSPYGISKAMAEKELTRYGIITGAPVYLYRLPNLFGRGARPNYNSVVATFLYNIKYDKEIIINDPERLLTLVYINDLLDEFIRVLEGRVEPHNRYHSVNKLYRIKLVELAECIYKIKENQTCESDIYRPLLETYLTY